MIENTMRKLTSQEYEAPLSLIGSILIHVGVGIIGTWGTMNIYIFSYFHYLNYQINTSTNSIILLFTVVPMALCMLVTSKLISRFGEENVMRIGSLIFMLSPLIALVIRNFYAYVIFVLILPASIVAIITIPALRCLWSQYPNSKSKVTALIAIASGVGTAVWNPIITKLVNPNNESVIERVSDKEMHFFRKQVIENIVQISVVCFFLSGLMSIIGSFLMKEKKTQEQPSEFGMVNFQSLETNQASEIQSKRQTSECLETLSQKQDQNQSYRKLSDVFKDRTFILLMVYMLISTLFRIQVMLNFKLLYIQIVENDHFLTYCIVVMTLGGMLTAYLWGYLCDKKGIGFCVLVLVIIETAYKILSFFITDKITLFILILLIGIDSKALGTFVAPGWVQLYGVKMGKELIPYQGIAFLLGFIFAPLFQFLTDQMLTPQEYLNTLALSFLVTTPIALIFSYLTWNRGLSGVSEEQKK